MLQADSCSLHALHHHFGSVLCDMLSKTHRGRVSIDEDQEHEKEAVAILLPVEVLHAVQKLPAFSRVAPVLPRPGSDASSSIAQGSACCQQCKHLANVLPQMLLCGSAGIRSSQGVTYQGSTAAEASAHALLAMDLLFRRVMRSRGFAESSAMAVGTCCISGSTTCEHRAATLGTQNASWLQAAPAAQAACRWHSLLPQHRAEPLPAGTR